MKKPKIKVVLLGTGYPFPHPDRSGPSIAVIVNGQAYIVDAGPGVVRRMQEAFNKGETALKPSKINKLFITHLHSDHTLGYPDIIYTPWVVGREDRLQVYGPKGIKEMTEHIEQAYKEDIYIRTHGLEKGNHTGYKVDVKEITPGVIYKDENVIVKAFKVRHGIWKQAYGLSFIIGKSKIVISGDTIPHPNIIKEAKGCDLLIHEVYSVNKFEAHDPEWKKYLKTFHTSTIELASIANKTKPKKLVLIHQLHHGASIKELLKEITLKYKGKTIYGKDLDSFKIQ